MKLIQDRSNSAAEAQEAPDIHGHAGNISSGWPPASSSTSVVRLASRTSSNGRAAHVSSSSSFSSIRDRSDRGLNETGGRRPEQRAARPAACPHRRVASPGETHAFAVFPQDPGVTVRVRDVLRMRHHLSDSGVGQVACADPSPLLQRLTNASRPLILAHPAYSDRLRFSRNSAQLATLNSR